MYCLSCQKVINDDGEKRFVLCPTCGTKLVTAKPVSASSTATNNSAQSINPVELLREQIRLLNEINFNLENMEKAYQITNQKLEKMWAVTNELLEIQSEPVDVYVGDIDMPLISMIGFIFKWSIAAIILGIVFGIIWFVFSFIFLLPKIV